MCVCVVFICLIHVCGTHLINVYSVYVGMHVNLWYACLCTYGNMCMWLGHMCCVCISVVCVFVFAWPGRPEETTFASGSSWGKGGAVGDCWKASGSEDSQNVQDQLTKDFRKERSSYLEMQTRTWPFGFWAPSIERCFWALNTVWQGVLLCSFLQAFTLFPLSEWAYSRAYMDWGSCAQSFFVNLLQTLSCWFLHVYQWL